ncbi:MAG: class A beta-lactamase-related serine hydrolase [Dehalococcoidia bacterium]|nr:class A beta-lactamase-related serine hydrolase [Dehalococcoidia bacterium]
MHDTPIHGTCAPGFERVEEAFVENFRARGDVGAAVCVYLDGRAVVDLWGGYRDAARTAEWTADTIVTTYSNGKGWLATCMNMLLDRRVIDLDTPVAHYWPAFAQHGKDRVLVRHALTHTAGLPAPSMRVPDEAIYDFEQMLEYVAASEPFWAAGAQMGYHAATFGWINGGVLRHATGMDPGEFLRREVAGPLGLDLYWGTAPADDARTATFLPPAPTPQAEPSRTQAQGQLSDMHKKVFNNPPRRWRDANTRQWRAAVIPASNGHASARGLGRMYAAIGCGGSLDGVTLMSPASVLRACTEQAAGEDVITGGYVRRGLGFALPAPGTEEAQQGPSAFGHGGLGGSHGFADADHRLGFGYVMNQAGPNVDLRYPSLRRAVYASLAALPAQAMRARA